MGNFITNLYKAPEINPKNNKALSIPILNPLNKYGRNFHLAWLGFFVSFLSWFAFPPLLEHSIKKDLKLTSIDVANNNIAGLSATLIARFLLGPVCDSIGPRYCMVLVLILGTIPTALVPLVHNIHGLHAIRFFIGLLGGSFIPCQMWTTNFFDKSVVGRANALAGGWGNAGGGVAFFVLPLINDDLTRRGYDLSKSWKLSFVIGPMIILLVVAILTFVFGSDCPEGKWSERSDILQIGVDVRKVDIVSIASNHPALSNQVSRLPIDHKLSHKDDKIDDIIGDSSTDTSNQDQNLDIVQTRVGEVVNLDEIIEKPSLKSILKTTFHYRTMLTALPYFTTFGGELAVEAILTGLYVQRSGGQWSQSYAGSWGSMLGLLNVVTRPLGGWISDLLYARFKTTKVKKFWLLFLGAMEGIFLIWIGLVPSLSVHGLIGALGVMCIFMEAGNGANFALVPHVNKSHTGIVAGCTGAIGNLGGILFSLVFRFSIKNGVSEYMKGFWIIGIVVVVINVGCGIIPIKEDRPDELNHEQKIDV
ncbi:putative membrane protein [Wickerhamomyces ciferrii]|uniref:Nitrate/nitrite transporter n=1 Tax=Wickerhamomyces ciferrii (strain ATCC 14091 / BCRC 22168 / CBS 111 / JCM 3599 / NBRC 0793 / NRRL Y-1031 F-60-10) TaxID=1206466 RepID=K0KNB9_WICCF|nr:uncharacterized protein BN7_2414 [Wickerhamomyces ciferrii]CCH42869.1 putative membrane protein [Wickerhamomyces ciferrii]